MAAEKFNAPVFLKDFKAEDVQERMMAALPKDIDNIPAGFPYDFTMPTALVLDEFVNVQLTQTLQLVFPQFAWGEWLDLHGTMVNVERKEATPATGYIHIEGIVGTVIPKGTVFCTPATDASSSKFYISDEEATIPDELGVDIPITSEEVGTAGNVAAGTIILAEKPIQGTTVITNPEALLGGTEVESDDAYRERILEAYRRELSFVGNNADYRRWAREVDGIGAAHVIPEWNGPGTVKVVITDSNGDPATDVLCKNVYDYIMSPDDPYNRKAPIGATLTVTPPDIVGLHYAGRIELDTGASVESVTEAFRQNLLELYKTAIVEGELKYSEVCSTLINTIGVYDYHGVTINGSTDNIPLEVTMFPRTEEITLEEGES